MTTSQSANGGTDHEHDRHNQQRFDDDCSLCWPYVIDVIRDLLGNGLSADDTFDRLMQIGAPYPLSRRLTASEAAWNTEPTTFEYANIGLRNEAGQAVRQLHEARIAMERSLERYAQGLAAFGADTDDIRIALISVLKAGRAAVNARDTIDANVRDIAQRAIENTSADGVPPGSSLIDWR